MEIKHDLGRIIAEHIVVEDNKLVFNLTRKEFRKAGVPKEYYKMLRQNVKDVNEFIDRYNIDNAETMLEHGKDLYRQHYKAGVMPLTE